jgi:hypothetical protein
VQDTRFVTIEDRAADNGIQVYDSIGEVRNVYLGSEIDHAVTVERTVDGSVTAVTLENVEIEGSSIWYADGVRILGQASVNILNSHFYRTPGADPWSTGGFRYDQASAGVQITPGLGVRGESSAIVNITGTTIEGYNVGIFLNARGMGVKVENSTILGEQYVAESWEEPFIPFADPRIDFGFGPLGSAGGNTFGNGGDFAFYHVDTYNIFACNNEWGVPASQIDPDRGWPMADCFRNQPMRRTTRDMPTRWPSGRPIFRPRPSGSFTCS